MNYHALGNAFQAYSIVLTLITLIYAADVGVHRRKWSWLSILPFYALGLIPALGTFLMSL